MPQTSRSSVYAKRVGASIRAARLSIGLTQAQVASRMGVSAPYVVAVEAGRANPTVGQLAAFAEAMLLGLEVDFPAVPREYGTPSLRAAGNGASPARARAALSTSARDDAKE